MELPSWLSGENAVISQWEPGKRCRRSFIEKTLQEIVSFLRKAIYSEESTRCSGVLQCLDSRVKVLSLFYFLVIVNLCSHLGLLWGFYGLLLGIAFISKLPLRQVIARVWLVIPVFTGIMVLPSLFSWVRPGDSLWVIWDFGRPFYLGPLVLPAELSITRQGLAGAILLVSRVGISVSLAVILTLSTRWVDILRALRSLFVPRIFIVTLEMTYRYLFVFVQALEEIFIARKARDAGKSSWHEQRGFIAASMGGLFGKSLQMSEEVYSAMVARGYSGEVRVVRPPRLNWQDILILVLVFLAGLIIVASEKILAGS